MTTSSTASGSCVLSVDQGTTNSKALLVDPSGAVLAAASSSVGISHPRPGWVEQDAEDLWASVARAIDDCRPVQGRPPPRSWR